MAKINVSIKDDVLEEIEQVRKKKNINRSKLLTEAIKNYISFIKIEEAKNEKKMAIARAIEIQNKISKKIGRDDLVKDLRKFRDLRK